MYEFPCLINKLGIDEFEHKTTIIRIKQNSDNTFSLYFVLEFYMLDKTMPFYTNSYTYRNILFSEIEGILSNTDDLVEEYYCEEEEDEEEKEEDV